MRDLELLAVQRLKNNPPPRCSKPSRTQGHLRRSSVWRLDRDGDRHVGLFCLLQTSRTELLKICLRAPRLTAPPVSRSSCDKVPARVSVRNQPGSRPLQEGSLRPVLDRCRRTQLYLRPEQTKLRRSAGRARTRSAQQPAG